MFGPWAAGSALANGGEKITISKPAAILGELIDVDEVTYASEGDWGTRVRETILHGWDWTTPADGANRSLELPVSNDNGQNWATLIAALGATPGAPNSAQTTNVPRSSTTCNTRRPCRVRPTASRFPAR